MGVLISLFILLAGCVYAATASYSPATAYNESNGADIQASVASSDDNKVLVDDGGYINATFTGVVSNASYVELTMEAYEAPIPTTIYVYAWNGTAWVQAGSHGYGNTDENHTFNLTDDLPDADSEYKIRIRYLCGECPAGMTAEVDYLSLSVNYTATESGGSSKKHRVKIINVSDVSVQKGQTAKVKVDLENSGDYDEEDIKVKVRNCPSGWNCSEEELNLKKGEDETVNLNIKVPSSANLGQYSLQAYSKNSNTADLENFYLTVVAECAVDEDCPGNGACINYGCVCNENWDCSDWSECVDGVTTRECVDLNECGTELKKPSEEAECVVIVENRTYEGNSSNEGGTNTTGNETKNPITGGVIGTSPSGPILLIITVLTAAGALIVLFIYIYYRVIENIAS